VRFALDVWPDARDLPRWRALERRRSVGPRRAQVMPHFVASAVVRRMSEEVKTRRWQRTGVL
jgi:hypothetical protein